MKRIDHYQAIGVCIREATKKVEEAISHYHLLTNTGIGPTADEFMPMLQQAVRELAKKLSLPVEDRVIMLVTRPHGGCVHLAIPWEVIHKWATACGRGFVPIDWEYQSFHGESADPIDVSDRITCKNCRRVCGI